MIQATIRALWNTMTSMEEAKPIIVFPGKIGVDRVQRELLARGLVDVRTLRNLDGLSPEADIQVDMLQMNDEHDWKSIPVYIIGERFARGLDLADVGYVFLLTPPSSAAGYAHMAGRTGRRGLEGMAITLVRPKNNEVQRFAAIAEALGLKFAPSLATLPDVLGEDRDHDLNSRVEIETESKVTHPWANLSESSLKRKKNSELLDYLTNYGVESESSMKADLVAAIQKLHSQD
jgi:superfamily II DNA/RNA helicase